MEARNEHVKKLILPSKSKEKIVICDRFIDSTIAYQVFGKGVNSSFIKQIHGHILNNIRPDLTFVLKVKIKKAINRLKKRKNKNRYDKFSKSFYLKAQSGFIKIAKKNRNKYFIFDNSYDDKNLEKKILNIVLKRVKYKL